MARIFRLASFLLPGAALAIAAGCSSAQPTGTSKIVDPTITRNEVGGTDDILQVCQKMVNSMRRDEQVAAKPSKLVLLEPDGIKVDPKLHGYDARMLYNDLKAKLNRSAGGEFKFIDRGAVAAERARQLQGQVKTSGVSPVTAGADMILDIELIAMQGGKTTTVQYNFKLTDVVDGIELWTDNDLIVKKN